jgi:hypothetical protein
MLGHIGLSVIDLAGNYELAIVLPSGLQAGIFVNVHGKQLYPVEAKHLTKEIYFA